MKFAIVPQNCVPFHAYSLDERPLGGTETGVIRLAEALHQLGQQVVVLTQYATPPVSQPMYLPFNAVPHLGEIDVLISVRDWRPLFSNISCKKRFFWTGDSYDQLHSVGIGDQRAAAKIDALLAVSDWHADSLCAHSGYPREKAWAIRNGVHLKYFEGEEQRARKRLIYSSTPYRGLTLLPPIYSELKQKHPELELHVFSGYTVYSGPNGYNKEAEAEFEVMKRSLEQLPNVYVHGNLKQAELAREFMKSSILAYPNTFEETSCITVMEAQAAGCAVVTSNLGALPETVGEGGLLIDGEPGSEQYMRDFTAALDRILSDDALFNELRENGQSYTRANSDWLAIAARFIAFVEGREYGTTHKESETHQSIEQTNQI